MTIRIIGERFAQRPGGHTYDDAPASGAGIFVSSRGCVGTVEHTDDPRMIRIFR